MRAPGRFLVVAGIALGLAGCGSLSTGVDGLACAGSVDPPAGAAVAASSFARLGEAQGASGRGGICAGRVFVLRHSVRAWRVWDSSRHASEPGRWWSLSRPAGSREAYRRDYAICDGWSALDRLVSCEMKAGTVIVVGTTQSADCEEGIYPKSGFNQVYLHTDAAAGGTLVENCRDEGAWPSPSTPEETPCLQPCAP